MKTEPLRNYQNKDNLNDTTQIYHGSISKQANTELMRDKNNDSKFRELLVKKLKRDIRAGIYKIDTNKFYDALKNAIEEINDEDISDDDFLF